MPLEIQSTRSAPLHERRYIGLAGASPVKVDIRVIAATTRDLQAEVAAGRFRQDLFNTGLKTRQPCKPSPCARESEDVLLLPRRASHQFMRRNLLAISAL